MTPLYQEHINKLLKNIPNKDNKFYIDDVSSYRKGVFGIDPVDDHMGEFMLRRNTGIKSLFPHPSLFKRNADGTISLIRNWDDPRVNYKQGGKLIKKQNIKNN